MKKIRVLIVDDSGVMRKILSDIISQSGTMDVVGTAINGFEAVQFAQSLHPDVITMDVNMPKMNGILAVEQIMKVTPTPIVMISSTTQYGAEATLKALDLGAVDFVAKPSGDISLDIGALREEILSKVKVASKIKVVRIVNKSTCSERVTTSCRSGKPGFLEDRLLPTDFKQVIAIGCSTGGPQALNVILPEFPLHFPPILVVQHMPEKFTKGLAKQLDERVELKVVEAQDGDKIKAGMVYIAPGSHHMEISSYGTIQLYRGDKFKGYRPSIDIMMTSVAGVYGKNAIGVLLTGMGSDGAEGLYRIKQAQGKTIAQDESTSAVFGMPKVAIDKGCVDYVIPLPSVASRLMSLAKQ
jgi:two-component system chemotaxis response regulator CheB